MFSPVFFPVFSRVWCLCGILLSFLERKHFSPYRNADIYFLTKPLEIILRACKVNTIRQAVQMWKVMLTIESGVCVGTDQGAILSSS